MDVRARARASRHAFHSTRPGRDDRRASRARSCSGSSARPPRARPGRLGPHRPRRRARLVQRLRRAGPLQVVLAPAHGEGGYTAVDVSGEEPWASLRADGRRPGQRRRSQPPSAALTWTSPRRDTRRRSTAGTSHTSSWAAARRNRDRGLDRDQRRGVLRVRARGPVVARAGVGRAPEPARPARHGPVRRHGRPAEPGDASGRPAGGARRHAYGAADDPRGRRRRDGRRAPGGDPPGPYREPRLVPGPGAFGASAGLAVRPPSRRRGASRWSSRDGWGTPAFVERCTRMPRWTVRRSRSSRGCSVTPVGRRRRSGSSACCRSTTSGGPADASPSGPGARPRGARGRLDLIEQAMATAALIQGAARRPLPPEAARLWHPSVIEETLAFCGVERPPPEVDTVLSTVLFTDIVGSTERAGGVGDRAWKDLVLRHHAIVREALGRWRGTRTTRPATASMRHSTAPPARSGARRRWRARPRTRDRGPRRHPYRRVRGHRGEMRRPHRVDRRARRGDGRCLGRRGLTDRQGSRRGLRPRVRGRRRDDLRASRIGGASTGSSADVRLRLLGGDEPVVRGQREELDVVAAASRPARRARAPRRSRRRASRSPPR